MRPAAWAIALVVSIGGVVAGHAQMYRERPPVITPVPRPASVDAKKVALGRVLFHDRRLSPSMRISCASCHDLGTNGASATRLDLDRSGRPLRFNTSTVFNSTLSFRLGWEGRTRSMPAFLARLLHDGRLMSSGPVVERRLRADPRTMRMFRTVYGAPPDERLAIDALAAFLDTLRTVDAPFDRWLRGDRHALTPQALRGYRRFVGLGCASCHHGVNVGGNLFQRRGVFALMGNAHPRYIRVPSLRNVTVTAPYFHDGRVAALPDAIRQMATSQLNLKVTDREVDDLVAFLASLNGCYGRQCLTAAKGGTR